jgi:solute carrier family 13 (sodium-dependent dicarboxylate transporter), member 2/3/5
MIIREKIGNFIKHQEQQSMNRVNYKIIAGIVVAGGFYLFADLDPAKPEITAMAAVALLMAFWWITEAIPIAATALIPLFLFPMMSILNGNEVAESYINSTIFLFMGGFLIAIAMEKWDLHKRISLKIISLFGGSLDSIVLGFMVSSFFISMWISNTATAVMMLPIALSIIHKLENEFGRERISNFSKTLMLGIAYSCSIGGISTLIGTPPNISMSRIYKIIFPQAPEITFGSWMIMALPIAIILLICAAILLIKILYITDKGVKIERNYIIDEYKKLGRISNQEKAVGVVFVSTALLWIFRTDLNLGFLSIPGWDRIFYYPKYINDGTVAIAMGFLLFVLPGRGKGRLLSAEAFQKIPWGVIILFGGGFALATGFTKTGLSDYLGGEFKGLGQLSPVLIILLIAATINFLSELTSNTATAEMILPVMASVGVAMGVNPLLLMITATLSASMAFMLPAATPPNTIAFASERITIPDMVKAGFSLNIIAVIVISLFVYLTGSLIFDLNVFPEWAK